MYVGSKYKFSLKSCNTTIVLRTIHVELTQTLLQLLYNSHNFDDIRRPKGSSNTSKDHSPDFIVAPALAGRHRRASFRPFVRSSVRTFVRSYVHPFVHSSVRPSVNI